MSTASRAGHKLADGGQGKADPRQYMRPAARLRAQTAADSLAAAEPIPSS